MKLLSKDIKIFRKYLFEAQNGICPICEGKMIESECVLDHDHITGHCRAVLHRGCNGFEGKAHNLFKRYIGKSRSTYDRVLHNIIIYTSEDYDKLPIHPTFPSELEKELKELKKSFKKLKTDRVKDQYKEKIKTLQNQIKEERKNHWEPYE